MVLITPHIEPDADAPHGGRLIVSFPQDSKCETFSVPLDPSPEVIATWPTYVSRAIFMSNVIRLNFMLGQN